MHKKSDELNRRKEIAQLGGGQDRIDSQHTKGKLTARERILLLFDEDSFEEIGMFVIHRTTDFGMDQQHFYGDGVITGYGLSLIHISEPTRLLSISYAVF